MFFQEFIHQIEHVLRPEGGAAVIRALDAVERHILPGLLHLVVEQQTLLKGHQPILRAVEHQQRRQLAL